MYSFFYGMFNHESMNNLDSVMKSTFHKGGLTNAPDCSIAHILWKKRREGGNRREKPDRMSRKYKKKKRLEVRIISKYSQASDHSNFV